MAFDEFESYPVGKKSKKLCPTYGQLGIGFLGELVEGIMLGGDRGLLLKCYRLPTSMVFRPNYTPLW